MKKESKMGFAIEMEFAPELISETGQHNSFYEDEVFCRRITLAIIDEYARAASWNQSIL